MTTKTFPSADSDFKFTVKAAATPQFRTDRLVSYLTTVCGLGDKWQTKHLTPLLNRWMGRRDFLAVCREAGVKEERVARLESLLKHLHRHQVKDWLAELAGSNEEGTPARELADGTDYWNLYAKKFGASLLKVRAVQHEGTVWFRLGDVAAVAEDQTFAVNTTVYVERLPAFQVLKTNTDVKIRKTTKAVRLFTRRELRLIDDRSTDEGTRKGDWYVTQKGMEFIIGSAARKSKPAAAFLDHVLEVLHGRAENMVVHSKRLQDQRAEGTATREASKEQWPEWTQWNADRKVSPITATSAVLTSVLGASKKRYMNANGIREPFRNNVEEGVLRTIVTGQAVTMQIGSNIGVRDTAEVCAVASRAGLFAKRLSTITSLEDMDDLYAQMDRSLPK
jgi:prophage antirepressor-like protein